MRAEIVGVGTEILLGQIANDNARWMSERLAEIGVDVLHHQAVGDNEARIADAFRVALSRAEVVLATGGLGPTQDDITREGLGAALGVPLIRQAEIERFLRERFARLDRHMPEANLQQCDVPEGGRWYLPERGTAPGLAVETPDGKRVYLVAGVPAEMREMMTKHILPELTALVGPAALASRQIRVTGISEALVGELLDDLFRGSGNPSVAYLANSGEVKVRITAKATSKADAEALIAPLAEEVARRLGDHVYTSDDQDLEVVVGRLLEESGQTVAAAESLTGGSLGARLSGTPGASAYFRGSAVCYTADGKRDILGVSQETIEGPGVVSEQCAREMARGARGVFGSDLAVSVTGVAGPDPHDGKPVGTVCVGLAGQDVEVSLSFRAPGDRDIVRRWSEQVALDLLRRHLAGLPVRSDPVPSTGFAGPALGRLVTGPRPPDAAPKPLRLFVAVDVPEAAKAAVRAVVAPFQHRIPGARWTAESGRHVTVKFLGGTWPRMVDDVRSAISTVAASVLAFETRLTVVGVFPGSGRARVIWVGLDDPEGRFAALAGGLETGLAEDFAPESRAFTPHITVARLTPPRTLREFAPDLVGTAVPADPWLVRELVLYRSHLSPHGATYEALERFPLAT